MAELPPSIRLKILLQQRHWQSHKTFCIEYNRVAKLIEADLAGSAPSRAQFHRWLSGTMAGLPYPHHCRVLEAMFPDWSIDQLFEPPDQADDPSRPTAAAFAKKDIGQLFGLVDRGMKAPDRGHPAWGPVQDWSS